MVVRRRECLASRLAGAGEGVEEEAEGLESGLLQAPALSSWPRCGRCPIRRRAARAAAPRPSSWGLSRRLPCR